MSGDPLKNIFQSFLQDFNPRLLATNALLVTSVFNHGFDNQGFSTVQAMTSFKETFGTYSPATGLYTISTFHLSLLNSLQYIGFAVGLIVGSLISAKFGRRKCILSYCCWAIICAIITVTSQTYGQILSARILNYIFIGMEMSVVPLFQAEITPKSARGFMVGTFQFSINLGGLIVHIIANATQNIENDRAWRIPCGLFFVVPVIVGSLIMFAPESPRWLVNAGREDEGRAALVRYRKGKFTEEQIDHEFEEIKAAIVLRGSQDSYVSLFKGTNLRRTLICIFANFFQQATGQAFASQYGTIFIQTLNALNAFVATIISSCIGLVAVILCLLLTDKLGRKTILLIGSAISTIGLFVMGGLGCISNVSGSVGNGIIGMMFVFGAGYSFSWAPLCYVLIAEIPNIRLRDKTQRLGILVNIVMAFVVAFTLPYLLNTANLKSKVGFIYGSFSLLSFVFVWIWVPDCNGKTLEEVDYLFNNKVAARDFKNYKVDWKDLAAVKETISIISSTKA